MSERPDVYTDSAGATHTDHECRWAPSAVYPGFDVCLVNPFAHYRERAEDTLPARRADPETGCVLLAALVLAVLLLAVVAAFLVLA